MGEAVRRYPLCRVSRILAGGHSLWEVCALSACLERGIPVTFVGRTGSAAGLALPLRSNGWGLNRRLEEFLARPDWKGLYENWRRAAERREILRALRHLQLRVPDLRPGPVRRFLEGRLAAPAECLRRADRYWMTLLVSMVAERLSALGLRPTAAMGRRSGFDLLTDFAAILAWGLWGEVERQLPPEPGRSVKSGIFTGENWQRTLTELFEEAKEREGRRLARLIDGFDYWLGGFR